MFLKAYVILINTKPTPTPVLYVDVNAAVIGLTCVVYIFP
jgi:hypothetical protein